MISLYIWMTIITPTKFVSGYCWDCEQVIRNLKREAGVRLASDQSGVRNGIRPQTLLRHNSIQVSRQYWWTRTCTRTHEVMFFTGYRDYNYRGLFIIFTDAAALVSQLTLDEIKQLEAETDIVKDEKREIFGPDGKPIDLSQFGQVQIDPKYV